MSWGHLIGVPGFRIPGVGVDGETRRWHIARPGEVVLRVVSEERAIRIIRRKIVSAPAFSASSKGLWQLKTQHKREDEFALID